MPLSQLLAALGCDPANHALCADRLRQLAQELDAQQAEIPAAPDLSKIHPVPSVEKPRRRRRQRLPDFLREDELARLFAAGEAAWRKTPQPAWRRARRRDWLMVLTAYYAGLRVAELANLRVDDIDLAGKLLFVRQGKGSKDGTVPIAGKLAGPLREWIGDRTNGVLFPDPRGGHIDHTWFRDRLRGLAKRAGIVRRVHPHILRHSCATHLLRRGASVYEVQRFLRHSSLSSTSVYLHLDGEWLNGVADLL